MAVHRRRFHPYDGPPTAARRRFLVPARYALQDLAGSKLFLIFLTVCFLFPLLCLGLIYLRHNVGLLETLTQMGADVDIDDWVPVNEVFFGVFQRVQGTFAFFLVLFCGPRLVSRDLANNGLALYLCRPFSKAQYVASKLVVLAALMSAVTWVPGLLLWAIQAGLEPGWGPANLRIAGALVAGSWLWIFVLGFLALAVSAWVRWRAVAGFLLLLLYFGGGLVAQVIKLLFRSDWGHLLDLHHDLRSVWAQLYGTADPFFFGSQPEIGAPAAWLALAAVVAASLLLLRRRIRAYEVIR